MRRPPHIPDLLSDPVGDRERLAVLVRPPPRPAPPDPGRRACLRCLGLTAAAFLGLPPALRDPFPRLDSTPLERPRAPLPDAAPGPSVRRPAAATPAGPDPEKQRRFDEDFGGDLVLTGGRHEMLRRVVDRLARAEAWVGHGRFNLLGFDDLLRHARTRTEIGAFTAAEIGFLEEIFSLPASELGFFGNKVLGRLADRIDEREVVQVEGTGHYLLRGASLGRYREIRRDLGPRVVLTSGVRGLVKQFHLFLAKAVEAGGNLSRAARSLAPPGYSYHAVGDFDLGKVGLGADNFTARFAATDEYRRLIDLGYVEIRYPEANPDGVRFEPWHIRIG